ncbi:MAG TPA: AI-2E family transporter [Nitrolancea sp.]|nr:AI-2E family transporter [Nitrolancea sp.]
METEHDHRRYQSDKRASPVSDISSIPLGSLWRWSLVAASALVFAFGLFLFVWKMATPLEMLLFAIVIAESLSPVIGWLSRWIHRSAAIVLVYLTLILIIAGIAWLIFPPVIVQMSQGVGQTPDFVTHVQTVITRKTGLTDAQLTKGLTQLLARFSGTLSGLPLRIATDLFNISIVYFLSIYWLFVTPSLKRFIMSLARTDQQPHVERVIQDMGKAMGGYVRGSVLSGLITGSLAFAGLMFIHVNYALALGFLTFFGELIPVVGIIAVGALVVIVASLQSLSHALLALAVFTIIIFLESHLIAPYIMRSQTTVSQVMVLFALIAGAALGGILGALVAIPLSGAIRVMVIEVLAPGFRCWTGATPDIEFVSERTPIQPTLDGNRKERFWRKLLSLRASTESKPIDD